MVKRAPNSPLLCIELPNQVPKALDTMRRCNISDFTILALTPHVECALRALRQSYRRPEDYHSEEDINAVGFETLAATDKFCDSVDGFLHNRWDLLKEESIRPARLNWYFLNYLLSTIGIRAFIMRRVLAEELPETVLYFGTRDEPLARELNFVSESAWSRVIPVASAAMGIHHRSIADNTDPSLLSIVPGAQHNGLKESFRKIGLKFLGRRNFEVAKAGYNGIKLVKEQFLASRPGYQLSQRPKVITLDMGYSLGYLMRHVQAHDQFEVIHWDLQKRLPPCFKGRALRSKLRLKRESLPSKPELKRQCKRLWAEFMTQPELQGILRFSDIDCFPIINRRLRRFIEIDLVEIVITFLQARTLIRSIAPFAVLAATMGDYARQAIALAARIEQVPFVVYRHGAGGGYVRSDIFADPVVGQIEHPAADYILTFGQGDVDYYQMVKGARAKPVAVGSAELDNIKKSYSSSNKEHLQRKYGLDTDRRTVVYVPTTMDGNIRTAPYRGRSPSRMFEIESRIIEVFTEFPETQFIIKLPFSLIHPCSPIAQTILEQEATNCLVITEPLTSVLCLADMFVFDYSSTSFLEALTTDKPVFFCGHEYPLGWDPEKWPPYIEHMWNERVVYSGDLDEFLSLLRTNLQEKNYQPVRSNDTFLKLFGTHLNDGKSDERAYKFLNSLASKETL